MSVLQNKLDHVFQGAVFFPLEPRCRRGRVPPPLIVPRSSMFCNAAPAGGCYADFLHCRVKQNKDGTVCTKSTKTKRQMHTSAHTQTKKSNWNEFKTGKFPQLKERNVRNKNNRIYVQYVLNCFMLWNKKVGVIYIANAALLSWPYLIYICKHGTVKAGFAYSKNRRDIAVSSIVFSLSASQSPISVAADLDSSISQLNVSVKHQPPEKCKTNNVKHFPGGSVWCKDVTTQCVFKWTNSRRQVFFNTE